MHPAEPPEPEDVLLLVLLLVLVPGAPPAPPVLPPLTVSDTIEGRPAPLPQKPNDAVPAGAIAALLVGPTVRLVPVCVELPFQSCEIVAPFTLSRTCHV